MAVTKVTSAAWEIEWYPSGNQEMKGDKTAGPVKNSNLKGNMMNRKLDKRERKLLWRLFNKVPEGRRREGRRLAEAAAKFMGLKKREWGRRFVAGDEEARLALQAVASKDTQWMPEFAPPDGGRDWEGFFTNLMACLTTFIPLFL